MVTDHSLFRVLGMPSTFKTDRSAGADVTAMGVFSDIFKFNERA